MSRTIQKGRTNYAKKKLSAYDKWVLQYIVDTIRIQQNVSSPAYFKEFSNVIITLYYQV